MSGEVGDNLKKTKLVSSRLEQECKSAKFEPQLSAASLHSASSIYKHLYVFIGLTSDSSTPCWFPLTQNLLLASSKMY